MDVFISVMLLILGMVLLIKGADFFVDGASNIAKSLKIPTLVIGLTLVSIGTSAPEFAVSLTASLKGSNELSFGNIVGSNIFNTFIVIGISSIITPLIVSKNIQRYDLPILTSIYLLLALFAFVISKGVIILWESIILFSLTIIYTVFLITREKKNAIEENNENNIDEKKNNNLEYIYLSLVFLSLFLISIFSFKSLGWFNFIIILILDFLYSFFFLVKIKKKNWFINIIFSLIGLGGIILGGDLVVNGAKSIALKLNMSEMLIGLTIVAIGTSLPELVTSTVAAKKGENDIAVGNAIGSCIFNVILILGFCSILTPATIDTRPPYALFDVITMIISVVLIFIFSLRRKEINKYHGIFIVCLYILYLIFIILRDTGFLFI